MPDLNQQDSYSYGFWIKYQPYWLQHQASIQSGNSSPIDICFIFAECTLIENKQISLLTLDIDKVEQKLSLNFEIQTVNNNYRIIFSLDPLKFEGSWVLFFVNYDLQEKLIWIAIYYNEQYSNQFISDYPQLANEMRYTIGGTYTYYNLNGIYTELQQFPGKQSNMFTTNNVNVLDELENCKPVEIFPQSMRELSEQKSIFNGQTYDQYDLNMNIECKKLEVKGWIKLDKLALDSDDIETVVLRMSINPEQNDDKYIGDKFLYIKYHQSNMNNNYISITTYSYSFPIQGIYTSQPLDTIIIEDLSKAVTEWHFFRFEQHRDDINQPLFTFYFPTISALITRTWDESIRYFTGTRLLFFIGGDSFSNTYMQGIILNWSINWCYNIDTQFKLICHHSCQSCSGPLSDQCIECSGNSNRIYSQSQTSCYCKLGYIEIGNECEAIEDIYHLSVIEESIQCEKEGFIDCEGNKCLMGYFQVYDQCIKCPEQNEIQMIQTCGDCILYQDDFQLLCTFDFIVYNHTKDNVYQKIIRKEQDFTFYQLNLKESGDYYLSLCQGCLNYDDCKITYYRNNGKCFQCSQGCKLCLNELQCIECLDGYIYSDDQICYQCELNCETCESEMSQQNEQICINCIKTYYLDDQYKCQKCGAFCLTCDQSRCFTCLNNSEYFITMDGINCAKCPISNCKYCFQFYKIPEDNVIVSTLDYDFTQININSYEIQTGCAYCENSHYYNLNTLQCESQNFNVDNKCLTGIINQSITQCLIHDQSDSISIQNTNCSSILYCKSCIINNTINFQYCVICNDGYYSELNTGTCIECPSNCQTCIQVKDSWKFEIMAFYFFLNNNLDYFKFIQDYQVICTSCYSGLMMYQDTCIQGCSSQCLDCQIISGIAQCVRCPSTQNGLARSVDSNLDCQQCSKYCQACYLRDRTTQINPFYQGQEKFTNICYLTYSDINDQINLFNQYGVVTTCKQSKRCQNTILIQYDVYCSEADFEERSDKNIKSISIKHLLESGFESLNNQGFYEYLNQIAVRNVTFELTFILGKADSCSLSQDFEISTLLFENIFSLQYLEISFVSKNQMQTPIQVNGTFIITDFTKVSFFNFIFLDIETNKQEAIIQNSYKPIDVYFVNLTISSNSISFLSFSIKKALLQNVLIKNIQPIKRYLFTFLPSAYVSHDQYNFQTINLTIQDSQFYDSIIFYLYCDENNIDSLMGINDVDIYNTMFENSYLLRTYFTQQYTCGKIQIQRMNIKSSNFSASQFITATATTQMQVYDLAINSCKIESSIILALNMVNITNFHLLDSIIINSTIISNQIETVTISAQLYLNQIIFEDNIYHNKQAFINLQTSDDITINNFQLLGNKIDIQRTEASFQDALVFIQCLSLKIDGVFVKRAYGNPEFSFRNMTFLSMKNGIFEMLPEYITKTLHSSVSCIKNQLNMEVFAIYIDGYQNVELINITTNNLLFVNYPFLIIKSKDAMEAIQFEEITIQNCVFANNIMLLTATHKSTSLISITSQQQLNFNLENTTFSGNLLNEYIQDLSQYSTTTILLQSISGVARISNSNFSSNVVINSTDSILIIIQDLIQISNSTFQGSNILEFSKIRDKILYSFDQFKMMQYFIVESNSGNGYLMMETLIMKNVLINNSYGIAGGGFMIIAQNDAQISIDNCEFNNTKTSLKYIDYSKGGTLFIDASKAKLNLSISNTQISNSYSRHSGGGIYIEPSKTYNFLSFFNFTLINSISFKAMFLFFECSELVIQCQINFYNSTFTISEDYFSFFIGQIIDLQGSEISDNPILDITYSDLIMKNCTLLNTFMGYFLDISFAKNIKIEHMIIINTMIFQAPILKMSLDQVSTSKLMISKLDLRNIIQKAQVQSTQCLIPQIQSLKSNWTCSKILNGFDYIEDSNISDLYLQCNLNTIFTQTSTQNFSLIMIELSELTTVQIKNLDIQNNNCSYCIFGLVGFITQTQLPAANQVILNKINIRNNTCGMFGCIIISGQEIPKSILQQSNNRALQENPYIYSSLYNMIIQEFICLQNKAEFGVCLFSYNNLVLISNALMVNNFANQIGGAVFYYGVQNIKIFNVQVANNTANIAGGIYTTGQFLPQMQPLKVYLYDNKGIQSNSQIKEYPRALTISLNGGKTLLQKQEVLQNETHLIEEIIIQPYKILGSSQLQKYINLPSGQAISSYQYFDKYSLTYIPYNLTLRLIALNKFNQIESGLSNTQCEIIPEIYNLKKELIISNHSILSTMQVQFNDTTNDYNLDELIFYFNPYDKDKYLNLRFSCTPIEVPIFNQSSPYELLYSIKNYYLNVKIQTFICQLGEYFNSTLEACILCDSKLGQFSVKESAVSCKFKDDVTMKTVKPAMIQLKPGYWRAFIDSEKVEQCYHLLENCEGGWKPGSDSCAQGHIGALCEQCDLYNIRQLGSYSVSSIYQCGSCNEITMNIITITVISIWAIVSIILSVNSTIKHIAMFIMAIKIRQLGVKIMTKESSTAIYIKVFTNYLQILSTISTFSLQVPSGVISVVNSVGNPLKQMAYSLDCFLVLITDFEIIYFRLIWSIVMAFTYIGVFFTSHLFLILFKKSKYNITVVSTAFIYMYIYLQPDLLGGLVSLTSFRVISDESWIQGNVAYRYHTDQHLKWLLIFVLPLLFALGFFIPLVMFLCVYFNREKLDRIKNRCKWGYLYNEYKHEVYYWEMIKIIQKSLIIIALTFYEDYVPIKGALVFLLLFFYSFGTHHFKPYTTLQMNYLDSQSTIFCSVSIVLASTIYIAQTLNLSEIMWPCLIIMGILNGLFILNLLTKIVFQYFDQLYTQIDWLKDQLNKKYPSLQNKYKFLKYIFETNKRKQERIKRRYLLIKHYLMRQARQLIEFKKNQSQPLLEINSLTSNQEITSAKSILLLNLQQEKCILYSK